MAFNMQPNLIQQVHLQLYYNRDKSLLVKHITMEEVERFLHFFWYISVVRLKILPLIDDVIKFITTSHTNFLQKFIYFQKNQKNNPIKASNTLFRLFSGK